jgi:hypothetical protein
MKGYFFFFFTGRLKDGSRDTFEKVRSYVDINF